MAIDVASQADWNAAVAAVAAAGAGATVSINVTAGFNLTSSLAQLQANNANVTVNITGNNQIINGASFFQGIQVNGANAPSVNISNLSVTNTVAIGGTGLNGQPGYYSAGLSYGSGGGGGGGLGAGGGLFVGSGANVTLSAVTFTGNTAIGGTGGNGGAAQNAASDPVNGGNGGVGGAANNGGAAGGGGLGGTGGHTGTQGTAGSAGPALGAGGGGGGGSGTTSSTSYTSNNAGGGGNADGGTAGSGGDGVTNNNGSQGPGADGGFGGASGSGQGGAIYVATGGTLTILDTPISGAAAVGGSGGSSGIGAGPSSFNGSAGANGSAAGAGIFLGGVKATIGVSSGTVTYANTIGGTGLTTGGVNSAIDKTGTGTLALSATNTFIGNVNILAGTLSVAGTDNLGDVANGVAISHNATFGVTGSTTFASGRAFSLAGLAGIDIASGTTSTIQGVVSDGASQGNLAKFGTGTLVLTGNNTYSGQTLAIFGTLRAGSANAFGTSTTFGVATAATLDLNGFDRTFAGLSGGGTVTGANSTISGTFTPGSGTPGTSMAIVGNLTFQAGAQYSVTVNPTTSTFAAVTGTATLGNAAVTANFLAGSYIQKKYTILTATGGVSGTFSGLTSTGAPPSNLSKTLSYDANDVYLNVGMVAPASLNDNQKAVFNTLTNFFNTTGGIPAIYVNLSPAGLTQASGEAGTGSQQTTFNAMNMFMGIMTDPFIAGRGDNGTAGAGAAGYADEAMAYAAKRRPADALAAINAKAPGPIAPSFSQRWSVWAAGYGGSQTTDGNAAVGSNTATSSIYGTAVGADYRISPDTIAGFSMAGGGTNFSVANSGYGSSYLFQTGAFVRHNVGAAYISGALAYGAQDVTTNRVVTIAGTDRLQARFNANAYSGRVEGGYRFVLPWTGGIGVTPYGAAQFVTLALPSYAENVISGGGAFALAYGARAVTDTRSELGLRTDKSFAMQDAVLTLRGRAAWSHDYNPDRSIGATFTALPGASFVVNGAAQASDAALVSAAAEVKWANGWSAAGTFEGEFSNVTRGYAGKGVVRYAW